MALTAANALALTDKMAAMYLALKGDGTSTGYGGAVVLGAGDNTLTRAADYGMNRKARDLEVLLIGDGSTVYGVGDYASMNALIQSVHALQSIAPYEKLAPTIFTSVLQAINNACAAQALAGVTTIDQFATYMNTGAGGPNNCLLNPYFAEVYKLTMNTGLTAGNVWSPLIQGNPGMGAWAITGAGTGNFTGGTAVTAASYVGAGLAQVQVEAALTGAPNYTVTVTGTNQAGTGGRTWTGTITGNAQGATYTLTPGVATDCLVSVQAIAITGATAGTVVVWASPPAGRTFGNTTAAPL